MTFNFVERLFLGENMKKILMAGAILLAICITISAVSADEGWSFNFSSSDESNSNGGSVKLDNNLLTIQDFKFTIPDGFEENESAKLVGEEADQDAFPDYKISSERFDKGDDSIIIKVVFGDKQLDDDTYEPGENYTAKKLADEDGWIIEYDDGFAFDYIEDGKLVEIFAPDEQSIADLINSTDDK